MRGCPVAKHARNRLAVDAVFRGKNAGGQGVGGVAGQHRHHSLLDDGPGIETFIHIVNGATGLGDSGRDRLLLRMQPGK